MKFRHEVQTQYKKSFRADTVLGMFDIPEATQLKKSWDVDLPIEDTEWNIGLIVGPSGAGKTTLAKRAFGEDAYHTGFDWQHDGSLLDDFKKGIKLTDITGALSHVGFSSPPSWLQPYHTLSNGQKFRAELARLVLESEDLVVFDEFTSVVDRTVAKASSAAVAKFIRRQNKQFVAVSCHYDIAEWLEPDWIYQVDTGEFRLTRGSLRRPGIELEIFPVHYSAWQIFKGHHYLTANIKAQAKCFLGMWEGEPVSFVAALNFPHPHVKGMYKAHRTVVLPDYQGVGIGNAMSEAVGDLFIEKGHRYTSVTSHPAMIAHRKRSSKWITTRLPGNTPQKGKKGKLTGQSSNRMTASFEYIGEQGNE